MRKVFYIPEGHNIDDYKDKWFGNYSEIHTNISPNNKDYILDKTKAHQFYIPEFQRVLCPKSQSHTDYVKYMVEDDFAEFEKDPVFKLEVWEKDYDDPTKEHTLKETYPLTYTHVKSIWSTNHLRFDAGWYVMKFFKNDTLFGEEELTVWFLETEEE